MTMAPPPWEEHEVEKLRSWRAEGLSNAEISRRLGRTQRSVAAKLNGLGLPSAERRPPPRKPRTVPEPVHRAPRTTLPPLPSLRDDSPAQ